jgi:hypothetical protein
MQNSNDKCAAAPNRVAAGKQAGWLLSLPRKMVLTVLLVL